MRTVCDLLCFVLAATAVALLVAGLLITDRWAPIVAGFDDAGSLEP